MPDRAVGFDEPAAGIDRFGAAVSLGTVNISSSDFLGSRVALSKARSQRCMSEGFEARFPEAKVLSASASGAGFQPLPSGA
jgi:hypothetical protein